MKFKNYLFASLLSACVFFIAPAYAQTNTSESAAINRSTNQQESLKSESELNEERFDDAKASKKEYKRKAKDAKRIENEAKDASKQAKKALKMEKRAQKAREKAEKQSKKAERAANKSDRN